MWFGNFAYNHGAATRQLLSSIRFVRFVSTPEVLERVNAIEAEILQIGEAITIQGSDNLEISPLEDHPTKCNDSIEGDKHVVDAYTERAIILHEPQAHPSESNISKEACLRFVELWKQKHETGQWVEIEADKVMMAPFDFSSLNISGIVRSGKQEKQRESKDGYVESHGELCTKNNSKTSANGGNLYHDAGLIFLVPSEHRNGEFFRSQYQAAPYAQWVMHLNIIQCRACISTLVILEVTTFFQTPHAPLKDQRNESSRKNEREKQTFCRTNSCSTSKNGIENFIGLKNDYGKKHRSKVGRSRRKNTYNPSKLPANSKRHNASRTRSEVQSQSEPESEQEVEEVHQIRNKNEHNNSKNEDSHYLVPESDNKHRQAFPNSSMQDAKESSFYVGRDILSSEKEVYYKMKPRKKCYSRAKHVHGRVH